MSKRIFKVLISAVLVLIILINTVLALMLFQGAGYKFWWEKSESIVSIKVTEIGVEKKEINHNKINVYTKKGVLEVFENIFVKEKHRNKFLRIRSS